MSELQETWEDIKNKYQQRYVKYLKEYIDVSLPEKERQRAEGHMHECSYVLHIVFGLTDKQINELDRGVRK